MADAEEADVSKRNIVAATDFSPHAQRALRRAADLALQHDAELHLIHVIPEQALLARILGVEAADAHTMRAAREEIDVLAEQLREKGVAVTTLLERGPTARSIMAAVERLRPFALVVGAHGRGSVKDMFGTTAERLAERAGCPVLVARTGGGPPYRRVVVGVDLCPASAATLAAASDLCPEAELLAVYAYEPLFEMMLVGTGVSAEAVQRYCIDSQHHASHELRTFLDGLGALGQRARPLARRGLARDEIIAAAAQDGSTLIAVGRNASLASDFFLGSVSKHVLRRAEVDVLVVAAPA